MSAARKAGHEQRRAIARRPPAAAPPAPATASPPLFRLQRQAGNLAVQQLLPTVGDRAAGRLGAAPPGRGAPATPVVEAPDSPLERAAERHANQILRRQSATVVPGAEPGVPERVGGQRGSAALAPEIVGHVLASAGHPIEPPTRQLFESRFGRDFSRVRVHSDERAADSARSVGALAYTVGSDVVFGSGGYAPGTDSGRRLLAHELSHVLQDEGSSHARLHRQASGAVKGADPAAVEQLQLPSGGNLQAAQAVMAAVQGIAAAADGSYVTTYQGRRIVMTGEQAQRVRSAAGQALQGALNRSRRRLDDAVGRYQAHQSVARDFWFFSRAVSAFTWVRTLGAHSDPGEAIASQQANLNLAVAAAQQSIQAGALVNAAAYLADADAASERTARLVRVYIDQLIEGGESLATGLEYTRDAAFITLGVLAVIVTGGAAAGVAPGVIGTGIGGLSVGATATAISVAAPIVANVGVGLAKVADGDPVDWGSIAVDAAVQILLARFGGKLGEGVFGKVAGSPATRTLARQAVASVASGVATHEVGQAFAVSAHHAYNALRGRPVTWGNFVDDLTTRLADPKGLFIAAAMSSVQLGAHVAVDRRLAARPPSAGPAPAVQRPAAPKPTPKPALKPKAPEPAPEPVPEPKAAEPAPAVQQPAAPEPVPEPAPEPVPEPKAAEPAPAKPTAAAPQNADTAGTFAELRSELGPEPPTTGPVTGQKLGPRSAGEPQPAPRPPLPEKLTVSPARKAELEGSMLAQRRDEALNSFADVPDLQAALASSTTRLGGRADLLDLAADNPQAMRRMWDGWKLNTAKRAAAEKPPLEFADYVKSLQASEARGLHGERTDVFTRGANETIVAAPGRVNESGIDSVSFAPGPKGGRIKLLDNKAKRAGSRVGDVSALQQNLPRRAASGEITASGGNLEEAITVVEEAASVPGAPAVIRDVVLPRLHAASREVNDHVASWQRANPGKPLTDHELQTQIGQILDRHGIDRVVTTAGGGANVKISRRLRSQGFKQE